VFVSQNDVIDDDDDTDIDADTGLVDETSVRPISSSHIQHRNVATPTDKDNDDEILLG